MSETFTCGNCGRSFPKSESDEERARAELRANFGDVNPADCAEVCDDCYKDFVG
jgi:hypothetical protein